MRTTPRATPMSIEYTSVGVCLTAAPEMRWWSKMYLPTAGQR
jgi:hypothetical protein